MTREYVVPGRVELVGKHVDYAGGRSITCAVDQVLHATATPLADPLIRVRSEGRQGIVEAPLSATADLPRDTPEWGSYVAAVARRFARDFPDAKRGVELSLRSNLPASAGLSSSTALVVAVGLALVDVNEMEQDTRWGALVPDRFALAEYFAAMETGASFASLAGDGGVGVRGGAQDHVAIMCAEAGHVGQFSYLPARLERRITWPGEYALAIGVSGVEATKTGNARDRYNRASDATRALVAAWNASTGRADATLGDILRSDPGAAGTLELIADQDIGPYPAKYLTERLAQFRQETEVIVPEVAEALQHRDFVLLGSLVDRSQSLAEIALENQVPETILLARMARERGAVASSAFGAGFGGAVWAMVRADGAEDFVARWSAGYLARFPEHTGLAQWLVTRPGGPAAAL